MFKKEFNTNLECPLCNCTEVEVYSDKNSFHNQSNIYRVSCPECDLEGYGYSIDKAYDDMLRNRYLFNVAKALKVMSIPVVFDNNAFYKALRDRDNDDEE